MEPALLPPGPPAAAARERARVTVITRTRDRPLMLPRCLESVLNQSFGDWLHLIVNDGGNPLVVELAVAERAARYRGRAQIIHNPTSVGMQNASNVGVRQAAGDYVVIHDDDDTWQPEFLRQCVKFLDAQGAASAVQGVVTQTARVLEEINAESGIDELAREDYQPLKTIDLFAAGADNPFAPISFVYRRSAHEKVGEFDERFSVVGDWDFNLRFLTHYEIGVIEQRLANYHWRHRSGGSVYANTVTDALDVHRQKSTELRNHYLRLDLQAGKLGMGYLLNTAKLQSDARVRGAESINEARKIHNRLRHWEWLLTRNPRLKPDAAPRPAPVPRAAPLPGAGRTHPTLDAGIAGALGKFRVLSLDVFDTALLRRVRQPVDVFLLLEGPVRRLLAHPGLPVADLRANAEKLARDRQRAASGHGEVTIAGIYEAFCELAEADRKHVPGLVAIELEAEGRMLYGNPPLLAAARAAAGAGMRVVFASDMYLPGEFIRGQLRGAGYDAPDGALFVSGERGASKHAGDLYGQMVQALGVRPEEILHVGDNPQADVEKAREHGVSALHWRPALSPEDRPMIDQAAESREHGAPAHHDLLSSLCVGTVRRERFCPKKSSPGEEEDLWDRLGYEVGGPLYFLFLRWILEQTRAEGIDRLYFLARDGYHLREACDILIERAGLGTKTVYMAASRRLLNLPQFAVLDHDALQFLLTANPLLTVRHFLTRVGIDPEPLAGQIRRAGFLSADDMVTTHAGVYRSDDAPRKLRALFLSLEGEILRQAAHERGRLLAYFGQIGFTPVAPGKFAAVDLGWQASSARALQTLLNLPGAGGERRRLRAFYFGTWRFAKPAVDAGCRLDSFFFHLDKPRTRAELVAESVELIELFFGAPHPTIVGLRAGADGQMEPVYGESETSAPGMQQRLTRMRERAVDFVRDVAAEGVLDWPGQGFSYLEDVLARILRRPTASEARQLGALMARDSFGGSSPTRPLAQPPGRWERLLHPQRLRAAYQRAFWKTGFLAQLSPRAVSRLQLP